MTDYRPKLVESVKMAGQSIMENADNIVDRMDCHTEFNIEINFIPEGFPIIKVKQEHIAYIPGEEVDNG